MKNFLIALAIIAAAAGAVFCQSVTITAKTVQYKRPKPESEFKKTFSVTYPKVSGVSPSLAAKIEKTISYENVLKLDLKDEMGEYQWLEEATYEVGFNGRGVLSLYLSMSGTAAYPSVFGKNVVVNLNTGNAVAPADVFENLDKLAEKCAEIQKKEIADQLKTIEKDEPDFLESAKEYLAEAKFTSENLEGFSVNADGVTFVYDYGFPHVAQALEPSGSYLIRWSDLKPFVQRQGLLGKFVN